MLDLGWTSTLTPRVKGGLKVPPLTMTSSGTYFSSVALLPRTYPTTFLNPKLGN
jgi:hypothetical protein